MLAVALLGCLGGCGARQRAGEHGVTGELGLPEQSGGAATALSSPPASPPEAPRAVGKPTPVPRAVGKPPEAAPQVAPRPLLDQPLCNDTSAYCALVLRGEFEAARASEPARFEAYVGLGRASSEHESLSYGAGGPGAVEAQKYFREAVWRAPSSSVAVLELARIQLSLGQGEAARTGLESLALAAPEDAEVQASLGVARLSTGAARESLGPLLRARDLDPKRIERYLVLGTAQMLNDQVEEAERTYRAALSLDASSPDAHGNLGALLMVQGHLVDARGHLERARTLDPKRATFVSNLAYLALLEEKFPLAQSEAERALVLDPKLGSAWLNLGLAQARQKKLAEAKKSFERALALDPSDPRAAENLKELAELTKPR